MIEPAREQILDALQNGWGTYVERFHNLLPEAQSAFVEKQGFARFADILAHVIAWWEEGIKTIKTLLHDPGYNPPEYNMDAFNAQTVEKYRHLDELYMIQSFEHTRKAFLDLILSLPDDAFRQQNIVGWLHIETVGHLGEHEIQ
jgi:hypothetical protein